MHIVHIGMLCMQGYACVTVLAAYKAGYMNLLTCISRSVYC